MEGAVRHATVRAGGWYATADVPHGAAEGAQAASVAEVGLHPNAPRSQREGGLPARIVTESAKALGP